MATIKKLTIESFESIRKLDDFELRSLNVLIGANGAGKSNFVAFFFRLLRELIEQRLQLFVRTEGGADACLWSPARLLRPKWICTAARRAISSLRSIPRSRFLQLRPQRNHRSLPRSLRRSFPDLHPAQWRRSLVMPHVTKTMASAPPFAFLWMVLRPRKSPLT